MQIVLFISAIIFFSTGFLISIPRFKAGRRYGKLREKKYYEFIKDNPTIAGSRPYSLLNPKRFFIFCKPYREYCHQDPEYSAIAHEYKRWYIICTLWGVFGFLGIIVAMFIAALFSAE